MTNGGRGDSEIRFRELVQAKYGAAQSDWPVKEIDAELRAIGEAWGLDAEELEDAEKATAHELGLGGPTVSNQSTTKSNSRRGLLAVFVVFLWSALFGGIVWGSNQGYDNYIVEPAAEEACRERGWQYESRLRENRAFVGIRCYETDGVGPPVRHDLHRGYVVESLTLEHTIRLVVLILSLILGVALPTLILYYGSNLVRRQ